MLHHTSLLLHGTGAEPYNSITIRYRCYAIHLYYYTVPVLHNTSLLLHGTSATPYISVTTWYWCYAIHLLLHGTGATSYISIISRYRCYTIHLYYFTVPVLHHTSLLLHGATPYNSVATRCYTIHLRYNTALHHTTLILHDATPYISVSIQNKYAVENITATSLLGRVCEVCSKLTQMLLLRPQSKSFPFF